MRSTAREVRADNEDEGLELVFEAAAQAASNRLMDSLVHDARNPLNALSINLEVLTEKLKDENGELPLKVQKNLKSMRDQIGRVDGILREYSEFIAPRESHGAQAEDLSQLLARVMSVLGHEARLKRVQTSATIEPQLQLRHADAGALRVLLVQVLLRAVIRAPEESTLQVSLSREGPSALLAVSDSGPNGYEPLPLALEAIHRACERLGVQLRSWGGEIRVVFPVP